MLPGKSKVISPALVAFINRNQGALVQICGMTSPGDDYTKGQGWHTAGKSGAPASR